MKMKMALQLLTGELGGIFSLSRCGACMMFHIAICLSRVAALRQRKSLEDPLWRHKLDVKLHESKRQEEDERCKMRVQHQTMPIRHYINF